LRAKNSRVDQWLNEKINDQEAITRLFLAALSRSPQPDELKRFTEVMRESSRDPKTTRREVFEDLFWGMLTGKEFLFNH
jgi:hypothetical protein